MASLMENLIDTLEKECRGYDELLQLSMDKTPAIVAGDLSKLAEITDEEQIVVSKINRLDHKRQEVITDIANVMNKDVENCKLMDVIHMLDKRPEEQNRLSQVYDRLKDVVYQVKRVNEQNRTLLTGALEMVDYDINLLQSMKAAPETANYNKGAYSAGVVMGNERKRFDAKQ